MSPVWITIAVLAVVTFSFKAAGPLSVGGRALSPRTAGVVMLAAPSLLAGLVVYETLGGEHGTVAIDARLIGLGGAVAALALRLPIIAVVAAAGLLAAGARATGLAA